MARGGAREGAGRPKGAPNKATADIRDIAAEYTADAVAALVQVMKHGAGEAARVAAANAILDRAFGKAKQSTELSGPEGGPVQTVSRIELVGIEPDDNGAG